MIDVLVRTGLILVIITAVAVACYRVYQNVTKRARKVRRKLRRITTTARAWKRGQR